MTKKIAGKTVRQFTISIVTGNMKTDTLIAMQEVMSEISYTAKEGTNLALVRDYLIEAEQNPAVWNRLTAAILSESTRRLRMRGIY